MAQLMLVLDELIVNTALSHIQQALHFSGTGLEWVVTGYAVTFGGLLMLGGRAGDILGRRRMFSAGILFFTLASLLGGFAASSWLLITAACYRAPAPRWPHPPAAETPTRAWQAAIRHRIGVPAPPRGSPVRYR
jgi:MFS family permease